MAEKIDYVIMTRSLKEGEDGPTEAQVHPDEVSNFAVGGWVKADTAKAVGESKQTLNAAQTIELVVAAQSVEELGKLAENETRKGVLDAIAKRRVELAGPAE